MRNPCIIPGCSGEENRSVFSVPKNIDRREKWLKAIRAVYCNLHVGENSCVCEKHFRSTDFSTYIDEEYVEVIHEMAVQRNRLKRGAVPHFDVLNLGSSNDPTKTVLMKQEEPKASTSDAMTAVPSKQPKPYKTQIKILKTFRCNFCKLQFPTRRKLNVHQSSREYECHNCKIPVGCRILLLKHKCCICKICNKPWGNADHKDCPKQYSCKCGEVFTSKRDFVIHQKNHYEIYGHCPTCCKQFIKQKDLINHVNKMKFPCIYCDTCFFNVEKLLEHGKVRSDQYICQICDETFEDNFAATSHSRSHGAPMRTYSRKPKSFKVQEKKQRTIAKEKVEANLKTSEFYKEPDLKVRVNGTVDGNNDERRLFVKVKEEPCEQRFGEDLEESALQVTEFKIESVKLEVDEAMREPEEEPEVIIEPKLESVKLEFEVDEEMGEPNQEGLDIGIPSKHIEGVKVEVDHREDM